MQVVLPPELEELVQRQIASGKYQTVVEVLVAGVQLLEHQEQRFLRVYHGRQNRPL